MFLFVVGSLADGLGVDGAEGEGEGKGPGFGWFAAVWWDVDGASEDGVVEGWPGAEQLEARAYRVVVVAVAAVGGVVDAHFGAAVELDAYEGFGGDDVAMSVDAARDGLAWVEFPV